jgi:hypothetical protein
LRYVWREMPKTERTDRSKKQVSDWVTPSAIRLPDTQGRRKGADQLTILNPAILSLVGETANSNGNWLNLCWEYFSIWLLGSPKEIYVMAVAIGGV